MESPQERPVEELAEFAAVLGATARDAARLLGLETQLALRTLVLLAVLAVLLAAVLFSVWCALAVLVAVALYEYAPIGLTASVGVAALLWTLLGGIIVLLMRRLVRRLGFPETRLAVQGFLAEAAAGARRPQ